MTEKGLAIVALVIAIVAVGLVVSNSMTGAAVTNSGQAKTSNTPCARTCTMQCTPNAALPNPDAAELSIHDCILQCMNAICGQTAKAGKCDAFAADGCCNIFATNDPDCAPTCTPAGQCAVEAGGADCCGQPVINAQCATYYMCT